MTTARRATRDDIGVIPDWLRLPQPLGELPPALTEPLPDGWRLRWPDEAEVCCA